VLTIVRNSEVGSGSSFKPEPDCGNRFYLTKTRTVASRPVLASKTRHWNVTTLAAIKFLNSDCIVTSSICRLCSFSGCFTSHFQICDLINIRGVGIKNWRISHELWHYCTAIRRISVGLQIWKREVQVLQKLHNLGIDNVTIQSELKNLIRAKLVATDKWNWGPVPT